MFDIFMEQDEKVVYLPRVSIRLTYYYPDGKKEHTASGGVSGTVEVRQEKFNCRKREKSHLEVGMVGIYPSSVPENVELYFTNGENILVSQGGPRLFTSILAAVKETKKNGGIYTYIPKF